MATVAMARMAIWRMIGMHILDLLGYLIGKRDMINDGKWPGILGTRVLVAAELIIHQARSMGKF
jgi:hypothetical protein